MHTHDSHAPLLPLPLPASSAFAVTLVSVRFDDDADADADDGEIGAATDGDSNVLKRTTTGTETDWRRQKEGINRDREEK
jgi:hypothetical protein